MPLAKSVQCNPLTTLVWPLDHFITRLLIPFISYIQVLTYAISAEGIYTNQIDNPHKIENHKAEKK